jgi:hypothetical protein
MSYLGTASSQSTNKMHFSSWDSMLGRAWMVMTPNHNLSRIIWLLTIANMLRKIIWVLLLLLKRTYYLSRRTNSVIT